MRVRVWLTALRVCILSPIIVSHSAFAATYLVKPDGSGAYATIQSAIDATAPGDTVALADGVFIGSGNRDILFHGKAIVVRSLGSGPEQCTIDVQGTAADQHRGFLFIDSEGPTSVLDGIAIRGGFWTNDNDEQDQGGGILCGPNTAPTIQNCVFLTNRSSMGGGVFVGTGSHPSIQACEFVGNRAMGGSGGGIGSHSIGGPARFAVRDCSFTNNIADAYAGAITVFSRTDVSGCSFAGNQAGWGGVFYVCEGGRGYFDRCTFIGNDSDVGGVGLT